MTRSLALLLLLSALACGPRVQPPPGMVAVPAGPARVGDDAQPFTAPREQVEIPAFWIDRTEVSNGDFERFLEATSHRPEGQVVGFIESGGGWKRVQGEADLPVRGVSLNDALAYAKWAGKRLPTEEEWEKAARGAEGRAWPWGDEFDPSRLQIAEPGPAPVDSHPAGASPYGALNMAGNVAEWTASPLRIDGRQVDAERFAVVKGGSLNCLPEWTKAAWFIPWERDRSSVLLGFRCAWSPGPAPGPLRAVRPYGRDEAHRQLMEGALLEERAVRDGDRVMSRLHLRPGETVADIGAGLGYFTFRAAREVGPSGTAYAVDLDEDVVDFLRQVAPARAPNVVVVKDDPLDARLPEASMDCIFLYGTYHCYEGAETEEVYRKQLVPFLTSLHEALKPGGRLVILDLAMYFPAEVVIRQVQPLGFELDRSRSVFEEESFALTFVKT